MLGLKSILTEIGIAIGAFALIMLWIAGIRREGREEGRVEQYIKNQKAKRETLKLARDAKRRFGMTVQDLEHDDKLQYKAVVYGKNGMELQKEGFEPVYNDYGRKLRWQYEPSPFSRD